MIIVVSGGFDPLHSGHINMFKQANELGPVWLLLNTDEWLQKKKGYNFLSYKEREIILTDLLIELLKQQIRMIP